MNIKTILATEVDGWVADQEEMSGAIYWSNVDHYEVHIMATPDWEDEGVTPFAFNFVDGTYIQLGNHANDLYMETLRGIIRALKQY